MCWPRNLAAKVLIAVFLGLCSSPLLVSAAPPEADDRLTVSGFVADAQGKGVKEVEIELLVNGRQFNPRGRDERIGTGSKGDFVGRYRLSGATGGAEVPGWEWVFRRKGRRVRAPGRPRSECGGGGGGHKLSKEKIYIRCHALVRLSLS